MIADAVNAVAAGIPLAFAYNPLASIAAAPIAAGLLGVKRASSRRVAWGVSVAGFAWLFGDGLRALARARDAFDAAAAITWPTYTTIGVWAIGTLLLGYVLPLWAGAFVGRRVTHGTGWVAAASIAAGVSLSLSGLLGGLVG
ncbi:MAG: hypothetical protein CVT69_02115 [Actinobacteria bacterium HGW-Actinobacteria-9]|nr:MAG: hypothetical protein CVT69_02115 [Actinobacteria bacterium HGW-Actinobacteria-9]